MLILVAKWEIGLALLVIRKVSPNIWLKVGIWLFGIGCLCQHQGISTKGENAKTSIRGLVNAETLGCGFLIITQE